jgi:hypothetical protein
MALQGVLLKAVLELGVADALPGLQLQVIPGLILDGAGQHGGRRLEGLDQLAVKSLGVRRLLVQRAGFGQTQETNRAALAGVLAGALLALLRARSGRFLGVGAVGGPRAFGHRVRPARRLVRGGDALPGFSARLSRQDLRSLLILALAPGPRQCYWQHGGRFAACVHYRTYRT